MARSPEQISAALVTLDEIWRSLGGASGHASAVVFEGDGDLPSSFAVSGSKLMPNQKLASSPSTRTSQRSAARGASLQRTHIETRAPLAERNFRLQRRLLPIGRVDPKYLGAEAGEKARRDGTGQNASEIEDSDAVERALRCSRPGSR